MPEPVWPQSRSGGCFSPESHFFAHSAAFSAMSELPMNSPRDLGMYLSGHICAMEQNWAGKE